MIKKYNPDKLILLGDIKHSIGRPFREEKQILEYFFWTLDDLNMETVIVKGNHDGGLEKYIENHKYVRIHEETWIKIELENEKREFSKYAIENFNGNILREYGHSLDYIMLELINNPEGNFKNCNVESNKGLCGI